VAAGGSFTLSNNGERFEDNNLDFFVNGSQNTTIHVSCSQPIGPGLTFGSFLVLQADSRVGGRICPFEPSDDVCVDSAGNKRKPRSLLLRYVAEPCAATSHSQDSSKVSCSETTTSLPATVFIRVSANSDPQKLDKVHFEGTVSTSVDGGAFQVDGKDGKFESDSFAHIFSAAGGTLLQTVKFHTSCSQPLEAGDQFGALVLEGAIPQS
jgi:hypothetical protein